MCHFCVPHVQVRIIRLLTKRKIFSFITFSLKKVIKNVLLDFYKMELKEEQLLIIIFVYFNPGKPKNYFLKGSDS